MKSLSALWIAAAFPALLHAADSAKAAAVRAAPAPAASPPGLYADIFTPRGKIVLRLEFEKAPLTVANFVGLAEGTKNHNRQGVKRFYDGLTFHRVIADFMIQGGDPQGTGAGGPGYQFPDEFDPTLRHDRAGILSMANAGPTTNGSQFFITHGPTPHLDDKHSVFGAVTEGQSVVTAVQKDDKMDSVRIRRVGAKAKAFKATEAAFQELLAKHGSAQETKKKAAEAKAQAEKQAAEKRVKAMEQKAVATPSGLKYVVTRPGNGPKPEKGARIQVHYTGTLADGTKFDSSRDRGRPFEFPVGAGMVIPGWDEALIDMRPGETRTLIIPPQLGYGERGAPPRIPPNATLVFDVELIQILSGGPGTKP